MNAVTGAARADERGEEGSDMTPTEFPAWLERLRAQAPFGPEDRAGTANRIDARARARGIASLTTDHLEIDCHGLHSTHLDALNHIGRHGTWYGGWAIDDPRGPSLADLADAGIVTRAVFADVPAVRGTAWVDPASPVTGDDIDAALAAAGVAFEPGDALLLRMGRDAWEDAGNLYTSMGGDPLPPGAGVEAARWIADHGVSVLGWDFLDSGHPAQPPGAVHMLIWAIGLVLIDNCDFAAARAALAAAGKATGLLVVAPLRIPGATGCTVNPLLLL